MRNSESDAAGSTAGEPLQSIEQPPPIAMLGVPFDSVTTAGSLGIIGRMIASGRAHYAATANVDFAVQALADVELRRILSDADLVLCDGMPLVWASRFLGNPLPERVAGSDLVPRMMAEAERRGWRVFFLGGAEESVARAAENMRARHPGLQLVGSYSPPFKPLIEMDHEEILRRVREARPDILLVAFGCPKQEKWIGMQFRRAGVPLSIGVGATIDFLGGHMRRAPMWMRRTGLEWMFRLLQEPRRLFRRYLTDFWVFGRVIVRQWWSLQGLRGASRQPGQVTYQCMRSGVCDIVRFEDRLNAATIREHGELWPRLASGKAHLLLDVSRLSFIDSTGVGLLLRLQKHFRADDRHLVLIAPTGPVLRAFALMGLGDFFFVAADLPAARALIDERVAEPNVVVTKRTSGRPEPLAWQGDIIAANADDVWSMTRMYLDQARDSKGDVLVNLADVRFIDTTGVRIMVKARKEAVGRGLRLKFTEPSPGVLNVLRILRMDRSLLD